MPPADEPLLTVLGPPPRRLRLQRGELLFRQGEATRGLFLLEHGRLRLERALPDGSSLTLFTAFSGDLIAEASLFVEHYHCDAVAERQGVVGLYPKAELLTALATDPALARRLLAFCAGQIRDLRALLEIRNLRPARERVLQYLRFQTLRGARLHDRPLRRLAAEIGLAHETVYRVLAELERDGVIQRRGKAIEILPRPKV